MKLPDEERTDAEIKVAWQRAATETRAVLRQGSAAWARHSCPGTSECCQLATTKRPPWLWPSEWKVLEARLARDRRALPAARADGGCPFLDAGGKRCTVYEDRPLGCRTFFCQRIIGPNKLPADETNALMERLSALNLAVDDRCEPRSILDWHALSPTLSPSGPSGPSGRGR
ncbi:MAG: YkgJ family cysteine cluster protein [Archangium sp.]|nr:YkgJ family cysteine cluster protein [Archangium sp.]MDP3571654.1 YkgJ family cysteine cluster protein [Archangium sp.]